MTELSFRDLVRGAVARVRGALVHHAVIAYVYILPALALAIPGAFDNILLIFLNRLPSPEVDAASGFFALGVLLWGTFVLTSWYRLALIGPHEYLRLDLGTLLKRSAKFLLYTLAVVAMGASVFLTMLMVLSVLASLAGEAGRIFISFLVKPIAVATAFFIAMRFLPSLAAISLGRAIGLSDAWRLTKGHGAVILAAAMVLMLPAAILSGLMEGAATQIIFGSLSPGADNETALAWVRGSMVVTVVLAPLSGAANALLTGIIAETYARLVGTPLDVRGLEV